MITELYKIYRFAFICISLSIIDGTAVASNVNAFDKAQSDLIIAEIEQKLIKQDLSGALESLENFRSNSPQIPPPLMLLEAKLASMNGDFQRQAQSLAEFFSENDIEKTEKYNSALELLADLKEKRPDKFDLYRKLIRERIDGRWILNLPGAPNPGPGMVGISRTLIFNISSSSLTLISQESAGKKSAEFNHNCSAKSSAGRLEFRCIMLNCPKRVGDGIFTGQVEFPCGRLKYGSFFIRNGRLFLNYCEDECEELEYALIPRKPFS